MLLLWSTNCMVGEGGGGAEGLTGRLSLPAYLPTTIHCLLWPLPQNLLVHCLVAVSVKYCPCIKGALLTISAMKPPLWKNLFFVNIFDERGMQSSLSANCVQRHCRDNCSLHFNVGACTVILWTVPSAFFDNFCISPFKCGPKTVWFYWDFLQCTIELRCNVTLLSSVIASNHRNHSKAT